jgi:hypothetical protein
MRAIIFFLLVFTCFQLQAQEELVAPGTNPVIKKYLLEHPASALRGTASVNTIDLPLIDDFSYEGVYPDTALWLDNYVFVNKTFARNPITIGVATFDGLNADGNAYVDNNPLAQASCDTLTSKPLFLLTRPGSQGGGQYSPDDSIRLGFFFQKKGWGDTPDNSDSLVLEFYNPSTNRWSRQWFSRGGITAGQDSIFNEVNLSINDTAFFKDGFQFRFRNYGSQTGALDQWHLDYVRLYKAKNTFSGQYDTTLYDVAFVDPAISLIDGYTSIPWNAWKSLSVNDQETLTKDNGAMSYRNLGSLQDIGFNHRIYDFNGSRVGGHGADNGNIFVSIQPGKYSYSYPVDTILPLTPEWTPDSNFYTVRNFFSNGNVFEGLKSNDTVEYKQFFSNYYSYDDGTAEAGYDLVNTPQGKLAQRFDLIVPDTLRAVRMHFVQQSQSVANKLFTIKIWSSLNPEVVIYQESNQRPVYTSELNGFATYVLDQLVPVSGTIYVGFQQVLADGLHLGFDRNTTSNNKMFYNFNGNWLNVAVANGSFMIRPVMGDSALFTGLPEVTSSKIEIFPTPASDAVNIRYEDAAQVERMFVYTADGRKMEDTIFAESLNTENYVSGVYFVNLKLRNGRNVMQRFVIQH